MAVYTKLSWEEVEQILKCCEGVEKLLGYSEISAGIENSNYFVDAICSGQEKRFVLTVFETLAESELPFFSALTRHLQKSGLPVPAPLEFNESREVLQVQNKPLVVVPCLKGKSFERPGVEQCRSIARATANMHKAQESFVLERPLVRDLSWMQRQRDLLGSTQIKQEDLRLIDESIERYEHYQHDLLRCPQGIVHGDLFRDNVLFLDHEVSGIIDFYHACNATLLFDVAVMTNDWAWDREHKRYDEDKVNAMIDEYRGIREWTTLEYDLWPRSLELAALRFWLSRLVSRFEAGYQSQAIAGAPIKDPDEMKSILLVAKTM